LYPNISNEYLREVILKVKLIRYTIFKSSYKAIDLFLEYINISCILDIKNNKNSIYNIYNTFKRFILNSSSLIIIRKSIENLFYNR
ncbi:hypothetical protein B0T20DRAFT_356137, partial [Sordaria brevicollis]